MRIAIVETGLPPPPLIGAHGDYPQMMRRMLAPHGRFDFFTVSVLGNIGKILPEVADFEGLLITGSPAGVYEDHAFIAPLKALVREAAAAGRPQIGICFGHQLMAEAFGGRAEKAKKGWGVGVHDYEVRPAPWMRPAPGRLSCAVSHQDQVVEAPAGATMLARSDFCPHAAISYAQGPATSFQMHPEFTHDYARALLDLRRERFAPALFEEARASLGRKSDSDLIARWIANFYEEHAP